MNYYTEAFKKYAIFKGRARRKEYWIFVLYNSIINLALAILGAFVDKTFGTLSILYGLAVLVPFFSVAVRRLHDTDHSAWWLLINLVPFVGAIIYIVLLATNGHPGENQYGPNPKEIKTGGATI